MESLLLSITTFLQTFSDMLASQSFWVKTAELLASLSILVFIHELGHYSWARIFGIKVEKFYLFFNPWLTLWKWKPKDKTHSFATLNPKEEEEEEENSTATSQDAPQADKATWRDTEYGLGWLPLGGYCAIAGMIDETQSAEKLKRPAQPWEFRSKSPWKRLLVMVGGVVNNFLLALVIYAGIVFTWGEEFIPMQNATAGYDYSESAHAIGFRDGDIPLAADGKKLEYLDGNSLRAMIMGKQVTVLRNNKDTVNINIPQKYMFTANKEVEQGKSFITLRMPVVVDVLQSNMGAAKAGIKKGDHLVAVNQVSTPSFNLFMAQLKAHKGKVVPITLERDGKTMTVNAAIDDNGKLGFQLANPIKFYKTIKKQYNLLESIPRGIKMGCDQMVNYLSSLKLLFSKEGAQSLGSFGAIGSLFPETWNWLNFWNITAFLSIMLAVMNILPIPALDGGHVVFLLYEMIFRRKPSIKFMARAQYVGMALLMLLMVYAFGNDIYRFLIK